MKTRTFILLAIFLSTSFCFFSSVQAGSLEEKEIKQQRDLKIQEIIDEYKPQLSVIRRALGFGITFPTTTPEGSFKGNFFTDSAKTEELKLWIWRENNFLWMKVEPISGPPSFSMHDFTLFQNSMEYSIMLYNSNGDYPSGDIVSPTVFQMAPSSYAVSPDLQGAFELEYEPYYNRTYTFDIPAAEIGCSEADLQAQYDTGFTAGSASCSGELYTQSEVDLMIRQLLEWGDIDGDGKLGLTEAIKALQTSTGIRH